MLYSDQLNFEPQIYNSESKGETIYLVLRNAHFEPAYPQRRKLLVNITLDDVSTDSFDLWNSSRQGTCSELNTSTPRKEKMSRASVKSSLTIDFSDDEESVVIENL